MNRCLSLCLVLVFAGSVVGQEYCPQQEVQVPQTRVVVPQTVVKVPPPIVDVPAPRVEVAPPVVRSVPDCSVPHAVPSYSCTPRVAPAVVIAPSAVTIVPGPFVTRYAERTDAVRWLFLPPLKSVEKVFSGPGYYHREKTGPLGFTRSESGYDTNR